MINRFFLFYLIFLCSFSFISGIYIKDVEIIHNCNELQQIKYNLDGNYLVLNEIDCSETINWNDGKGFEPIGNFSSPFVGSFISLSNISNLYINRPLEDYVGLFGRIYLNISDGTGFPSSFNKIVVSLKDINITGRNYVGAVAGNISNRWMYQVLNHLYPLVRGYSSGIVHGYGDYTGGIAGSVFGDVSFEGGSSALVKSGDDGILTNYIGGLFGSFGGQLINNSFFRGQTIRCVNDYDCFYLGGLVGYCYASANINGNIYSIPQIINSYAETDIKYGYSFLGGLVGYAKAININNSYFKGNVKGLSNLGGIVGSADYLRLSTDYRLKLNLGNSYSFANLKGGTNTNPLVGYRNNNVPLGEVENCYVYGERLNNVSSPLSGYFSGLIWYYDDYDSKNSYWDSESFRVNVSDLFCLPTGHCFDRSAARNTSDLIYPYSENTYFGWDFENVWVHDINGDVNNGYPYLKWEETFSPSPFKEYFYCGDSICGSFFGENCSSCLEDCGCELGYDCIEGECISPETPPVEDFFLKWKNPFGDLITSSSYSCSLENPTCNMILEVSNINDKVLGEECNITLYEKRTFTNFQKQIFTSTIKEGGICNTTWDFFTESITSGFSKTYLFKYQDESSNDLKLIVNSTIPIEDIASCGDYDNQISCELDSENVARYSVGNRSYLCGTTDGNTRYFCSCSWNQSNSICQGTFTSFTDDDDGTFNGSCLYTYQTEDTCDDGFLVNIISTSFNWSLLIPDLTSPEYLSCIAENGKEIIIPCPSSIKVPFFNFLQVLIVLGLIFIFYYNFFNRNLLFG